MTSILQNGKRGQEGQLGAAAIQALEPRCLLSATTGVTGLSAADGRWIRSTIASDQAQVALANLAASHASSQQVQSLASTLSSTYAAREQLLQQDAASLGVSYAPTLNGVNQSRVHRLTTLNGAAFDRAYTAGLVPDQTQSIALARRELATTQSQPLGTDASAELATLQSNLALSRTTLSTLRGATITGATNTGTTTNITTTGTTATGVRTSGAVGPITTTQNSLGVTSTIGNGAFTSVISPVDPIAVLSGSRNRVGSTFNNGSSSNATTSGIGTNATGVISGIGSNTGVGVNGIPLSAAGNVGGGTINGAIGGIDNTNFNGTSTNVAHTFGGAVGGLSGTSAGGVSGSNFSSMNGAIGGIDNTDFNGVTAIRSNTFGGATSGLTTTAAGTNGLGFSTGNVGVNGTFATSNTSGYFDF